MSNASPNASNKDGGKHTVYITKFKALLHHYTMQKQDSSKYKIYGFITWN